MDIPAEDLSIGYVLDGRHIGWMEDAEEVTVFTPDGNHIASLEKAPDSSSWTPTEIPGSPEHPDLNQLLLDDEDDILQWAAGL